jgi:four helix bundle protein
VGVRRFEDLVAWQLCVEVCDEIYRITSTGVAARDLEFHHQIRSAAKKAPALIAEGFLRWSAPEFVRYLRMTRGELGEILNHLNFARRQQYCDPRDLDRIEHLTHRALGATTKLLQSKLGAGRRS